MVQQVNAYPVEFEGRGFTVNNAGDYRPGEFKRLHNMELVNGRITSRRDIRGIGSIDTEVTNNSNKAKFIGSFNDSAIYSGPKCQYAVNADGTISVMWNPWDEFTTEYTFVYDNPYFHRLVGFFKYGYKNYWIEYFQEENSPIPGDDAVGIRLWACPDTVSDRPTDYTFAGLSNVGSQILITPDAGDAQHEYFNEFSFQNAFMHKDRLWVVSKNRIYFSAANDPMLFEVVDGGGFFSIPGSNVNYAYGLGDNIYIICDDSIHVFNYSTDPNSPADATLRKITSDFGGQHGCVFRNTPYFINKDGIFQIDSQYVTKVLDNDFDTGNNNFDYQRLTPYREYLVISKAYAVSELAANSDLVLYRRNLARNPGFKYARKGAPIVSHLGMDNSVNIKSLIEVHFNATNKASLHGYYMSTDGNYLYTLNQEPVTTTGRTRLVVRRLNVIRSGNKITNFTFDSTFTVWSFYIDEITSRRFTGIGESFFIDATGYRIYFSASFMSVQGGMTGFLLHRMAICSYSPSFAANVKLAYVYNLDQAASIVGYPNIAFEPATGRVLVMNSAGNSNQPLNITALNSSLAVVAYYAMGSMAGKFGDTIDYLGCPYFGVAADGSFIAASPTHIYRWSRVALTTSQGNTATPVTVHETIALKQYLFKPGVAVSFSSEKIVLARNFGNLNDTFYVTDGTNYYLTSIRNAATTRYALCFYQRPDGVWDSFVKETISIKDRAYWHLRPSRLPGNCTDYSLYVSSDQVNWYLAQDSLETPTSFFSDGSNPAGSPVGLGALPIPLTTPQYTDPETNIPEKYGKSTDTYQNTFFNEGANIRFIGENGVLCVFDIGDQSLQTTSKYTINSDGVAVLPVVSRIALEANKRYTISMKARATSEPKEGFTFITNLFAYANNATNTIDMSLVNLVERTQPAVTSSWVTVSVTFETTAACVIGYWVQVNGPAGSVFKAPTYDSCIQYKERMIEASSLINDYFDGDSINNNQQVVYKWDTTPEELSTSSMNYSSSADRNLIYPVYDKVKAESVGNTYHTNLIFANMDSGTIHSVGIDDIPVRYDNKIVDVIYNGDNNRSTGYPTLYFLTEKNDSAVGTINLPHFMSYEYSDRPTDALFNHMSSLPEMVMPIYLMEMDSIVTEDSEYTIKKFRNLEIMGKFPYDYMRLYVAYDDVPYETLAMNFSDPATAKTFVIRDKYVDGNSRPHFPHRMGLNQRARSISLKFTNLVQDNSNLVKTNYDKFELSSIRLLWSPTQRGPLSRNNL